MDPTPPRLRITLAHLDRRSMVVICFQLALGAAAVIVVGLAVRWMVEGRPIATGPGLTESPLGQLSMFVGLFAVSIFLTNFAGACLFRLFYWLRRRLSTQAK